MKVFILTLFIFPLLLRGNIVTIPIDYPTIQAGIDASSEGDTVLVQPGEYNENIEIGFAGIFLLSTDGPTETIIRGTSDGWSISVYEISTYSVINGFAIEKEFNSFLGGISIGEVEGSVILMNLIVRNNYANIDGGGIALVNSNAVIENCEIYDNSTQSDWGGNGGGIAVKSSNAIIRNSVIYNNTAQNFGGGVFVWGSECEIINSVIQDNSSVTNKGSEVGSEWSSTVYYDKSLIYNSHNYSPAIYSENSDIFITNSTIPVNQAFELEYCFADCDLYIVNSIVGNWSQQSNVLISNMDFDNDVYLAYNNLFGYDEYIYNCNGCAVNIFGGNVNVDPQFVNQSIGIFDLTEQSPLIDAGTTLLIFEGDTLVNLSEIDYYGTAPDIGAYEFFGDNTFLGDLNQDNLVNVIDILIVVNIILGQEPTEWESFTGDMNGDNSISVLDIVLIVNVILEE